MATVANSKVALFAQPVVARFVVPDADTWVEVVIDVPVKEGANRVALLVDGGGRFSHSVIRGNPTTSADDSGMLPDGQWLALDIDCTRAPRLYVSVDTAGSEVNVHVTRRQVCSCSR